MDLLLIILLAEHLKLFYNLFLHTNYIFLEVQNKYQFCKGIRQ